MVNDIKIDEVDDLMREGVMHLLKGESKNIRKIELCILITTKNVQN
jgi:hypothetical protein